MTTEIELKLRIAPEHVAKLRRHPALKMSTAARKLYSVYYDTPNFELQRRGVALRLRRTGKNWVQTVKGNGHAAGGLHLREEWDTPLAQPLPDFTRLPGPVPAELFRSAAMRRRLQPVFVTDFSRTVRLVKRGDSEIEFCLDRGVIKSNGRSEEISEIELELKTGSPQRLFEFALELQELAPLDLEDRSKAERGYRLIGDAAETPVKAGVPPLSQAMNAATAFKAIAWDCIAHMQANRRGMLNGLDMEYLHQMRVALRRLRSACKVSGVLPETKLADELRWFAATLGAARDWDVFASETLPPIAAHFGGQPGFATLELHCADLRAQANQAARNAIGAQRYQRLLLLLGAWLESDSWITQALAAPVLDSSAAVLEQRRRQVQKRGKRLTQLDASERHRLRISIKHLRYSAEFFAALYPGKRTLSYIRALAALQDTLGTLNDEVTTHRLLPQLETPPSDRELHLAMAVVSGWSAGIASRGWLELKNKWQSYTETKVFWPRIAQSK